MTRLRQLPRLRSTADARAGSKLRRRLEPGLFAYENQLATRRLYERLDADDVEAVERRVADEPDLELPGAAPEIALRESLVLSYGMWLGVPGVAEKTGLPIAQPPDDVHAMARGPLAAAGGLYDADMVVDALSGAGIELDREVSSGLDFGSSSGRLLRVLAAAYPEIHWFGCDPNAKAIDWAAENLPGIDFFVSGNEPPLELADSSLDLVSAISIWSHFEPALGLRWFDEMHRVIRPGGHLVCTTHGLTSVAFYAANGTRSTQQCSEIAASLYSRGWWYAAEFGEKGDWGVATPDWGTAFVSPEWLLANLCPRWQVVEFAPGRNQANQDVYVMRRG
jgi:SAM-dependent methyltransferase